jgi:hypothetical protein
MDLIPCARKCVLEAFFDKGNCKVRDIDTYPLALESLGGMNGCSAAAKGIKHCFILIARCFN